MKSVGEGDGITVFRGLAGAVGGAAIAVAYGIATGLALHLHGRAWEMGAIPLLLAGFVFVGLGGGAVAALVAPSRPYLAAFASMVVVVVFASFFEDLKDLLAPGLDRDTRRELWANVDGFLYAPLSLGVPSALWGAFLVAGPGPGAGRRELYDVSIGPAGFVTFLALLPPALHLLPPTAAMAAAGAAGVALVVTLRRRRSGDGSPPRDR